MDVSFFERLNQRKFRKMTAMGHKHARRLIIHPCFKSFMTRIVDRNALGRNFERVGFFDDSFIFAPASCYAFIIPPEIPVIRKIFQMRADSAVSAPIELWVQPRLNDVIRAYLCEAAMPGEPGQRMAPATIAATFPSEKVNIASIFGDDEPARDVDVYSLEMDLVPLDNDLFTMGSRYAFARLYYEGDFTVVSEVRDALAALASAGGFASVTSIGQFAGAIGRTLGGVSDSHSAHLILIDRTMDLITPLMTQMNYEGLLADFFGIDCGIIETDAGLHLLSKSSDSLFGELRSMNQVEVGNLIDERAASVKQGGTGAAGDGLERMKQAAKFALENQTLMDHINLAQKLFDRMGKSRWLKRLMNHEAEALLDRGPKTRELIQEMLEYGTDLRTVVRQLCLDSLLNGGSYVKDKTMDALYKQLEFNYGVGVIPLFARLQEMGLFGPSGQGVRWRDFVKQFRMFNAEWETTGEETAANYLGYVPLSVRLLERLLEGDEGQRAVEEVAERLGTKVDRRGVTDRSRGHLVVCIIGGCTHGEINTFRRLSRQIEREICMLATEVCSSNEFMDHLASGIPDYDPLPFL